MINITVDGVVYQVPSSAADVDWAAKQVAFEQALVTALGNRQRLLYKSGVSAGNGADNTEDVLKSYSVPAATLATSKGLRVVAFGKGVNTPDATTLRAYVGATNILSQVLAPNQGNDWRVEIDLLSVDGLTAALSMMFSEVATTTYVACATGVPFDVTAAQLVKFTGQRGGAAVANSVVQYAMSVELIP